jgi:hypothetical protein
MRLTVINGSPRRAHSNTTFYTDLFLEGFNSVEGNSSEVHFIYGGDFLERGAEVVGAAECVLIGFPLYADAMPSRVMAFFERLQPLRGREGNPPFLYHVQSGFPEAFHSRYVERYLCKLTARLGSRYIGSIIKGGGEGVKEMPERMTKRLFENYRELGRRFAASGELDEALLKIIAGKERLTIMGRLAMMTLLKPITAKMWNDQLKKNGAFERRFDRPYET